MTESGVGVGSGHWRTLSVFVTFFVVTFYIRKTTQGRAFLESWFEGAVYQEVGESESMVAEV